MTFYHEKQVMKSGIPHALDRYVAHILALRADDKGICNPSIASLSDDTGMSKRRVVTALDWLESAGHITRKTGGGFGVRTQYTVHIVHSSEVDTVQYVHSNDVIDEPTTVHVEQPTVHHASTTVHVEQPTVHSVHTNHQNHQEPPEEPPSLVRNSEIAKTAIDFFNAFISERGLTWPRVQKITKARQAAMIARLKDCGGMEGWQTALEKARGSPFLRGEKTNWRADFDFITRESSFVKLMEGKYDDQPNHPGQNGSFPGGNRQGNSIASIVARRHASGEL